MASAAAAVSGQSTFLEQFLESVRILPADVHRQLQLIKKMDEKLLVLNEALREKRKAVLDAAKYKSIVPSVEDLETIRQLEEEVHSIANEKLEIAREMQGVVDTYVQRLDGDLALFKQFFSIEDDEENDKSGSHHGSSYYE